MQDKSQKKSRIKEKILEVIDYYNINRSTFYQKTGITRGVLDQNNGISEENLAKFLAVFQEISLNWLFADNGNMLRNNMQQNVINSSHTHVEGDQNNVQISEIRRKDTKNISTGNNNSFIISGSNNSGISSDNRQYYSDSPDVLRAQIDERDRLIREKDERIREKDERIREKDERIREKDERIRELAAEKDELKQRVRELEQH